MTRIAAAESKSISDHAFEAGREQSERQLESRRAHKRGETVLTLHQIVVFRDLLRAYARFDFRQERVEKALGKVVHVRLSKPVGFTYQLPPDIKVRRKTEHTEAVPAA
jgi:hypothetical protein